METITNCAYGLLSNLDRETFGLNKNILTANNFVIIHEVHTGTCKYVQIHNVDMMAVHLPSIQPMGCLQEERATRERCSPHSHLLYPGTITSLPCPLPSSTHPYSPSHPLTLSLSHPLTLSLSHPLTLSPSHSLTLSPAHPLTLSLSHPLTLSPSHPFTLSPSASHSHPLTLPPHLSTVPYMSPYTV